MARMTSVDACEPELPPLEMISGMKIASTTARAISASNRLIAGGGEHLADEQHREPADALAHHVDQRDLEVGGVEGFGTADLLDVLGRLFLDDVDDVVDGDDALHPSFGVDDWEWPAGRSARTAAPAPPGPCRRGP